LADTVPASSSSKTKYLVVDDSPTVRQHLKYLLGLLQQSDDDIPEAANPAQAVQRFKKHRPDVVFLDMMMPKEGDGLQALRSILKENPGQKIVLVTALDQDHKSVLSTISLGVTAYLRKPITMKGLQQVLDEMEAQSGRFRRVG
jgi:two-component system chemotaxis response regulator CheY